MKIIILLIGLVDLVKNVRFLPNYLCAFGGNNKRAKNFITISNTGLERPT